MRMGRLGPLPRAALLEGVGVDNLADEVVEPAHYAPFARAFNAGHLRFILHGDWARRWAMFAAYERLDNVDCERLLALAQDGLGLTRATHLAFFRVHLQARHFEQAAEGLVHLAFFRVHLQARHFEQAAEGLVRVYQEQPSAVREAFHLIAQHQLQMWRDLHIAATT